MAELARMRSLAEARKLTAPRSLRDVQSACAADEAIVALNQFDDAMVVWVIRSGDPQVITRPLSRNNAEKLVARHRDDIWGQSASTIAGAALYNEVFRPVASKL